MAERTWGPWDCAVKGSADKAGSGSVRGTSDSVCMTGVSSKFNIVPCSKEPVSLWSKRSYFTSYKNGSVSDCPCVFLAVEMR